MKKAIIIPIQPVFSKTIKDLIKDLEIRSYAIPKGTKVYLYESIGKKKNIELWDSNPYYICWRADGGQGQMLDYITEGCGAVVAEFVVGKVHKLIFNNVLEMVYSEFLSYKDIKERGCVSYNYFKLGKEYYAHDINDLIVYDEDWQDNQFKTATLSREKWLDDLKFSPTSPIAITEFVSWNKVNKFIQGECGSNRDKCFMCDYDGECTINQRADAECNLTHAPQGKVFVVEKEW